MSGSFYLSLKPLIPSRAAAGPLDLHGHFGRRAPVEVEIGFGIGEYLLREAQSRPQHNFLGIENSWVSVRRTLRKIALAPTRTTESGPGQLGLGNVRLLLADARLVFDRLLDERSVHRVCALFPCPWPKKKHVKYRLFTGGFLRILNNRLCDEGDFRMVTDHRPFWEWVIEQTPGTGFSVETKTVRSQFDTKYERKWSGRGQSEFFELRLVKQNHIEVPPRDISELKTYLIDSFDPEKFSPMGEGGPRTIVFKEFLFDLGRKKGLVEVIASEENFRQHFWIAVDQAPPGALQASRPQKWRIYSAEGSNVIPTEAVKRALELAYEAACRSANEGASSSQG